MRVERDFEEFVQLLNKHEVKYLIVGAYSLSLYTEPRNTGDIDFFIERTQINAEKISHVLKEFGFDDLAISNSDLMSEDKIIQLGYPPVRIDIMTSISGVEFSEAYPDRKKHKFGKEEAYFISKELLIVNESSSNRKKDLADLEAILRTEHKK
jgi:hypothetical protein